MSKQEKERQYKLSRSEMLVAFQSLAVLQNAGINLGRALNILEQSAETERARQVHYTLYLKLQSGHRLSQAMASLGNCFSPFHRELIKVGEETGALFRVFPFLAEYEERQEKLRNRIAQALAYPCIVAALTLLALLTLPPLVLDGVLDAVVSSAIEPPLTTKILFAASSALGSPFTWIILTGMGVGLFYQGKRWFNSARGRELFLSLPGVGKVLALQSTARFTQALSISMKAGVTLDRAMLLAAGATDDPLMALQVSRARKQVIEGATLAESLHLVEHAPAIMQAMIASGEEVGRVDTMLDWVTNSCEVELESALDGFASMLEPLMMVIVGAIVAFIAIATLSPMTAFLQSL